MIRATEIEAFICDLVQETDLQTVIGKTPTVDHKT